LEEVMENVTVASVVTVIDEDEGLQYGEQTNEEGSVVRFQCAKCGHKVADTEDELFESEDLILAVS